MRIVSYNIHRAKDINNKDKFDEIVDYLGNLNCDVICLQEVLYHQYKNLQTRLEMGGIFGENVKKQKYGICILTDEKIMDKTHKFLTSKKEQRGFVYTQIKNTEGDLFNIVNTHLGLDKKERVQQIDEILDFIDNTSDNNVGNILCGDFNEKNICLSNLENSSIIYRESTPTFNTSIIDYCFVGKNVITNSYRVDKINFSDHYPIIIDFEK